MKNSAPSQGAFDIYAQAKKLYLVCTNAQNGDSTRSMIRLLSVLASCLLLVTQYKVLQMNTIRRTALRVTIIAALLGITGCVAVGAGVGAVAGSGTSVGVLGGAVIGGVVGYGISK